MKKTYLIIITIIISFSYSCAQDQNDSNQIEAEKFVVKELENFIEETSKEMPNKKIQIVWLKYIGEYSAERGFIDWDTKKSETKEIKKYEFIAKFKDSLSESDYYAACFIIDYYDSTFQMDLEAREGNFNGNMFNVSSEVISEDLMRTCEDNLVKDDCINNFIEKRKSEIKLKTVSHKEVPKFKF